MGTLAVKLPALAVNVAVSGEFALAGGVYDVAVPVEELMLPTPVRLQEMLSFDPVKTAVKVEALLPAATFKAFGRMVSAGGGGLMLMMAVEVRSPAVAVNFARVAEAAVVGGV